MWPSLKFYIGCRCGGLVNKNILLEFVAPFLNVYLNILLSDDIIYYEWHYAIKSVGGLQFNWTEEIWEYDFYHVRDNLFWRVFITFTIQGNNPCHVVCHMHTRAALNAESAHSANVPFSLAHSAESRFVRQKVPYFNVKHKTESYFNVKRKKEF